MSWPRSPGDPLETQEALAQQLRDRRQAVSEPNAATPCDRCGDAMADGIFRLSRSQWGGTDATWWICRECDRQLLYWWHAVDLRLPFRDTEMPPARLDPT